MILNFYSTVKVSWSKFPPNCTYYPRTLFILWESHPLYHLSWCHKAQTGVKMCDLFFHFQWFQGYLYSFTLNFYQYLQRLFIDLRVHHIWHQYPALRNRKDLQLLGLSCEPPQANLVLIAYASSEGSGEPAHPRSLARTFAARSYKQWVKRNLQTESQIPGLSEWLGMRT